MIDDYHPTGTWEILRSRAELLRQLREFFQERGFLEVETPVLSADTIVDRHIDPFWVAISDEGRKARGEGDNIHHSSFSIHHSSSNPQPPFPSPESRFWLQTSPEFHMKRLLAAGAGPIYQVARVFRRDELGPLHNPEFTLVEWYQPGEGLDEGMKLTSDLCETLLQRGPAERASYAEAFQRYIGIDPHIADCNVLMAVAKQLGIESPASLSADDLDGWLDLLLVERVQPHLGQDRPTLLYDYPASQAALARVRHEQGKPPVAERFELYVSGIELANGYHELLDPAELRARNVRANSQRLADGKPPLPKESRLLQAMEFGLPPAVGVALGFDRLVMLAAGAASIAEVLAFPWDRA